MASSDTDLATAAATFGQEEAVLQALITQAVSGDTNARTVLLPAEIQNAGQLRAITLAQVPDADASGLDAIVSNAENVVAGSTAAAPASIVAPAMFSGAGLRLGSVVIPWVGVLAVVAFVAGAVYFSKPRRGGSAMWA